MANLRCMPSIWSHGRLQCSSSATVTVVQPGSALIAAMTSASRSWWCASRPLMRPASPMNRYS